MEIQSELEACRKVWKEQNQYNVCKSEKSTKRLHPTVDLILKKQYETPITVAASRILILKEIPVKLLKKRKIFAPLVHKLKKAGIFFRWQFSQDTLPSELGTEWVNVTLDTDTANPQVIISEDRKSARWDVTRTELPHNPKRFKSSCCVLGCEWFDSGRHYWEVNVEDGGIWAVGVARGSVRRKTELKLTPEEGIWALQGDFGQYQALTNPVTPLPLSSTPRRIRVALDYERGQVEFFNAETKDSIFLFPSASFSGESVYPFFKVLLAQLTLDG